jgi:hypothetical protein
MFCMPGVLWLIVQSRWQEPTTDALATPAATATATANEEALEGRVG